jgi:hypothetical protein
MSKLSLVINTASKDPALQGTNAFRQSAYSARYGLMREHILPTMVDAGFDEVIVCGIFEAGLGYRYVPMAPKRRDRRDALHQRDLGAAYATGDILVFCHDDHAPAYDFAAKLGALADDPSWDLLVPRRLHGITDAEMNNGRDGNYMGGHCLAMRRWLWAEVPWTSVDSEWWDVPMTRLWREAGAKIVWNDSLIHYDLEATADES